MKLLDEGTFCPLLKKRCIGRECAWMVQLAGTNPNTGNQVNELFCAISALPMLLIENAKEVRQSAASTDSMRNEIVRRMDVSPPPTDFAGRLMASVVSVGRNDAVPAQIVPRSNTEGHLS